MTIPYWIPGRTIDLVDLAPQDLTLESIADALAKVNRFNGRTPEPWPVTSHSVLVERLCPPGLGPWALLHDAHESILGDITTPSLDYIARFGRLPRLEESLAVAKGRIDRAIGAAWNVAVRSLSQTIRRADRIALQAEASLFLGTKPVLMEPADEEDIDRAASILMDLPVTSDWRVSRDLWIARVEHYSHLGAMTPPRATDPVCALQA